MTVLARMDLPGGPRWAVADDPAVDRYALLPPDWSLADLARTGLPPPGPHLGRDGTPLAAPLDRQPVWAAGVTFERSRDARNRESHGTDVYDRVFRAERPELFLKASPGECRGPAQPVTVRADSGWNVPEPELGVLAGPDGTVLGYFLGNDMSSRDIEGENPLYLPQAKIWHGSCAVGPVIRLADDPDEWRQWTITLTITRGGKQLCREGVRLAEMRRTPAQLLDWLLRGVRSEVGVALLTGTSIVPDDSLSVLPGDVVTIACDELGRLVNPVAELEEPADDPS